LCHLRTHTPRHEAHANRIARNKFDEDAADRRHRENPHGDKVREVSAAFAEN
jgi:hypothetical protein